jgi:hypothetical protein
METGNLSQIKGLSRGINELLGAVGVEDLRNLAESEPSLLFEELAQANAHLEIVEDSPSKDFVAGWIQDARKITGIKPEKAKVVRLEEVAAASEIPIALPVKKDYIVQHKISVSEVPIMEDFLDEAEIRANLATRTNTVRKEAVREINPKVSPGKKESAKGKIGATDKKERSVIQPLQKAQGIDIRKTASPKLNEGKKLHSRNYVRGVLYPHPARIRLAAFVSVIFLILIPASFVAAILVLFKFPTWLLIIPGAFLLFGLLYLMIAKSVKCRICGQPLFSPMSCRRHSKAHHIPLIGYILPTSFHMLFFHWFRCIYCGTSVRLKE